MGVAHWKEVEKNFFEHSIINKTFEIGKHFTIFIFPDEKFTSYMNYKCQPPTEAPTTNSLYGVVKLQKESWRK
jgi:hypothetical protein